MIPKKSNSIFFAKNPGGNDMVTPNQLQSYSTVLHWGECLNIKTQEFTGESATFVRKKHE